MPTKIIQRAFALAATMRPGKAIAKAVHTGFGGKASEGLLSAAAKAFAGVLTLHSGSDPEITRAYREVGSCMKGKGGAVALYYAALSAALPAGESLQLAVLTIGGQIVARQWWRVAGGKVLGNASAYGQAHYVLEAWCALLGGPGPLHGFEGEQVLAVTRAVAPSTKIEVARWHTRIRSKRILVTESNRAELALLSDGYSWVAACWSTRELWAPAPKVYHVETSAHMWHAYTQPGTWLQFFTEVERVREKEVPAPWIVYDDDLRTFVTGCAVPVAERETLDRFDAAWGHVE